MSTTLDPLIGTDWLYDTLKADAILSHPTTGLNKGHTFIDDVDVGTPYPYTVIQMMSGVAVLGLGGILFQLNGIYMVKTTTGGRSYGPIRAIANRIVTLLNDNKGATATGQVFSCTLADVLLDPEHDDASNQNWRSIIQRFRLALR